MFDIFHSALKPGGLLFLGSSETAEDGSALFRVVDKKNRIYSHQSVARTGVPVPTGPTTIRG